MEIESVFENCRIRQTPEVHNGLDYYHGIKSNYPTTGEYLDPNSRYKYRFIDMATWIAKTAGPNGKVLDAGGATGNLGYWMEKLYPDIEITHTDFSMAALKYSKHVYAHDPIQCDVKRLPFQNGEFDSVIFADVLEHLEPKNAILALNETVRVLKQNGHLFLNIPNSQTWTKKTFLEPSHIWIPTIKDIKSVLKSLNFNNIKIYTRGFPIISNFRELLQYDPHFPLGGTSIFVSAQKQDIPDSFFVK